MNSRFAVAALLCLTACAGAHPQNASMPVPSDWKRVATAADIDRLRNWRTAFVEGLDAARLGGHAADVAQEGALLQPDAGLVDAALPVGRYRCRVVKLGARSAAMPTYTAYPAFDCVVGKEGDVKSFAKTSGSQRPVGLVFDAAPNRGVFLGTLMLSDESNAIDYGRDATRDMAGAVERVGPARWRLVLPYPAFESLVDVIELAPAT